MKRTNVRVAALPALLAALSLGACDPGPRQEPRQTGAAAADIFGINTQEVRPAGPDPRAAQARVRADLTILEQALSMYRLENARYPTTGEGLAALMPKYTRRVPNDPWSTPYVYVSPGPNNVPYRLSSLGADQRVGGDGADADITNDD